LKNIEKLFCNNVAAIIYLYVVKQKRPILFKQATAVFLLLMLCLVTVVQVLHSHTSIVTNNKQHEIVAKKVGVPAYNKSITESKCFVCEYQLAKDAEVTFDFVNSIAPCSYSDNIAFTYYFTATTTYSFFETRGPPTLHFIS